jgi:hypothetical protein
MIHHYRRILIAGIVLALGVGVAVSRLSLRAAETLSTRLTDQEFWRLSEQMSEPDGFFQSDNLLSNEIYLQRVIPDLVKRAKPGGVYMGVGPEQNYTYIAAIRPKMAFLPDIRRGNLDLQLVYKALFELSADRADFVSRLFSKKRPAGLTEKSTAAEIFDAYESVESGPLDVYRQNLKAIEDQFADKHHLALSRDDLGGMEYVYENFYRFGPHINYNSSTSNRGRGGNFVDYAELMQATDAEGVARSYLANEENFKVLKDLEERNLMVPVVGNLGGPKALRAIGKYVRDHGATITAFYLSNVEQYLSRDRLADVFMCNVSALPLDAQSTFIRSQNGGGRPFGGFGGGNFGGGGGFGGGGFGGRGGGLMSFLGNMQEEARTCPNSNSIR